MPSTQVPDVTNPVRRRMDNDQLALGMIITVTQCGEAARIAKATDHDFMMIDMAHGLMSHETVANIAQVAIGCGVAAMVRVPGLDDPFIRPMLDNGISGIVFPQIETADEARRAVEICRFEPMGRRSVGSLYSIYDYASVPLDEITETLNKNTIIACMIESRKGLENIEEIAAVDGFDVFHIGANDLMFDLGKPRDYGSAEMRDAVARILKAARRNGKHVGIGGDRDLVRLGGWIKDGVRFLTTSGDKPVLLNTFRARTSELRKLSVA